MSGGIVVVGSGAAGVHFALAALERGHPVTMLDAGVQAPAVVAPGLDYQRLKAELRDPASYFLGPRFEGVIFPDADDEFYGIPPNKEFIFDGVQGFRARAEGFSPLFSFARGGLAEAWTAGVYPLNDAELAAFPFSYRELEPHYARVAERIGVSGEADELARFYPVHEHLLPPLRLDRHSATLLETYRRARDGLARRHGVYMGRSRVAALSRELGSRPACDYRGRCLWGCPTASFYTPSLTLAECLRHPRFRYLPGFYVSHFSIAGGRARAVAGCSLETGEPVELALDSLVLAAGTLCSSRILLESLLRSEGEAPVLPGLMDNRQILVPFINLRMIGAAYEPASYQYHQVALGIEQDDPAEYVHGQITTLKTALVHPVIQQLPFDLRAATAMFRDLRAALGVVNVNLHDFRREDCQLALERPADRSAGGDATLVIRYTPPHGEAARIARAVRAVKRALLRLGCVVPPGAVHVRPMGASVHYAGTVPMCNGSAPAAAGLAATPDCRSRDFDNLFFVDGTTLPFLPAKNLTFTLMANAARVAASAF